MKQIFPALFFFFITISFKAQSATITAISDGDWTDTSVWSLGRLPQSGDNIIIPASRSIIIPLFEGIDLTGPETTTIRVNGVLDFALSDITIDSGDGDSVVILAGGSIQPNGAVYFDTRFNDPVFITILSGPVTGPAKIENGVLPIELISFEAEVNSTYVHLKWSTAAEINNDYFTILRSSDGLEYDELEIVPGAGNSSSKMEYEYIDKDPVIARSYYRIKQTDYNGDFEIFDPVSVDFNSNGSHSISFNNPVLRGGSISIDVHNYDKIQTLSIVNVNGQVEYTTAIHDNRININIDPNTKPGLYLVRVDGIGFSETARLLIK